jgi:cob(I)alamin adenosyltransferase
LTAFGHGDNFSKIDFKGSVVELTALLMLMRPKEDDSKYLSTAQKRISNELFNVELNLKSKLDKKALEPSYKKLEKVANMRNKVIPLTFNY